MSSPFADVAGQVRLNLACRKGEARRLFHGRGQVFQGVEHLNIDFYPPTLVIQLFREEDDIWLDQLCDVLRTCFADHSEQQPESFLVQQRWLPRAPWRVFDGPPRNIDLARENGLLYEVRFLKNQNLGLFLDMVDGRSLVRQLASGARVLNLFAYTCAFSVAAIAGGAEAVFNIDISSGALKVGRENHRHNQQDTSRVFFYSYDILKSFNRLRRMGPFDLIVIDPPAFQRNSFEAKRDYPRLVRKLASMAAPSAHVVACLNAPDLDNAFFDSVFAGQPFDLITQMGRPEHLPEKNPERSLKIRHYRKNDSVETSTS